MVGPKWVMFLLWRLSSVRATPITISLLAIFNKTWDEAKEQTWQIFDKQTAMTVMGRSLNGKVINKLMNATRIKKLSPFQLSVKQEHIIGFNNLNSINKLNKDLKYSQYIYNVANHKMGGVLLKMSAQGK